MGKHRPSRKSDMDDEAKGSNSSSSHSYEHRDEKDGRDHEKESRHPRSSSRGRRRRSRSEDSSRSYSSDGRNSRSSGRHRRRGKRRHRSSSSSTPERRRTCRRSRSPEKRKYHHRRRRNRSSSKSTSDSDGSSDRQSYSRTGSNYKTQNDWYKYQEPNVTVMIRPLAPHLTEKDIRPEVLKCGITAKRISVVRNETGESRGFAFVEFHSVMDATHWMDLMRGALVFQDQFQANLVYSTSKGSLNVGWLCTYCHAHNFKRREACYICHSSRPDKPVPVPGDDNATMNDDEVSSTPTSTIILRNLDMLTTQEGILQAFQSRPSIAKIPIRTVKIAKEPQSCLSRGVCYVEVNNVVDASYLLQLLSVEVLLIDGRAVTAAFARRDGRAAATTLEKNRNTAEAVVAAAQWSQNSRGALASAPPSYNEMTTEAYVEHLARTYASQYASQYTVEQYASLLDYYRQYYRQELAKTSGSGGEPAVNKHYPQYHHQQQNSYQLNHSQMSQSAVNHYQQQRNNYRLEYSQPRVPHNAVVAASGSQASVQWGDFSGLGARQGCPDMSRYKYDVSTGYYADPVSGLCYEANTQRFFDPVKQQFLRWSPYTNKYVVASNWGGSHKVDISSKGQVEEAKIVDRDAEKSAKALNEKRDIPRQDSHPPVHQGQSSFSNSEFVPAAFTSTSYPSVALASHSSNPNPSFQEEYNYKVTDDSDSDGHGKDDEVPAMENLVNEDNFVCLLCKRRLSSKEHLRRHLEFSELHKKNLADLRQGSDSSGGGGGAVSLTATSYRDRAKVRRDTVGYDETRGVVEENPLKDLYWNAKAKVKRTTVFVEEARGDKGSRMLQPIEWQKGEDLGMEETRPAELILPEGRRTKRKYGLGFPVPKGINKTVSRRRRATKKRN